MLLRENLIPEREGPEVARVLLYAGLALHMLLATWAAFHAVRARRDPRAGALWLGIVYAFPFIGPLLYWIGGINRIQRPQSRRRRRRQEAVQKFRKGATTSLARPASEGSAAAPSLPDSLRELDPLRRAADAILQHPLTPGNALFVLRNADEAYSAMLDAIAGAGRNVDLLTYIFDDDETGERFVEALRRARERGVSVRLLVDAIGAWGARHRIAATLRRAGVRVQSFHPFSRWILHAGLNLRNHRKILVVDDRVAFTGGMNVSGQYMASPGRPAILRDTHFRVEGPVVADLKTAFAEDWYLVTREALPESLPPSPAGSLWARGIASGPDETLERLLMLVLAALRFARSSIRITNPYVIPPESVMLALKVAARSGVRTQVIVPSVLDHRFIKWASRAYYGEMLEAGVEVYESPPPFDHSKYMVVDDAWSLIGSANLDPRSLRLNFEFNLEVYGRDFARELVGRFEEERRRSRPVRREDVETGPGLVRLRDGVARLFSPFL